MGRERLRSFLFLSVPSLLFCALALEVLFRTVVPASEIPYVSYDSETRILNFDPKEQEAGVFTIGKLAHHRSPWRVNDAGWNSEVDYGTVGDSSLPLIAVVGDSFIEALHVSPNENVAAVLRQRFRGDAEVISVGISGAPLSQYLHLVRHVVAEYDPSIIVVNVVHNDLAESLRSFDSKVGCLQVEVHGDIVRELPPLPYTVNPTRRVLRKSALVRYLTLNLQVQALPHRLRNTGRDQRHAANVEVAPILSRWNETKFATRYLVCAIREAAGERTLLFVMNALRDEVLGTQTGDAALSWMGETIDAAARSCDAGFVDLTETFRRMYDDTGLLYCFTYDSHWSRDGHRAAALAVEEYLRGVGVPEAQQPEEDPTDVLQGSG